MNQNENSEPQVTDTGFELPEVADPAPYTETMRKRIGGIGVKLKRGDEVSPDAMRDLVLFLNWSETQQPHQVAHAEQKRVANILQFIHDHSGADPQASFTTGMKNRAGRLYEEWNRHLPTAAGEAAEPATYGNTAAAPPRRARPSTAPRVGGLMFPPRDDPIFGDHGIMHGVIYKRGSPRTWCLDPRLQREKRSAQVAGHNGLSAGDWWPMQIVALFNGAHGMSQGGISGHHEYGAYSVVVSGYYADLDRDLGDTIFYSGPGSHNHRNPNTPPSGTALLETSLADGGPIRVLRSASSGGGESPWAPPVGIRYDGLYQIAAVRTRHNRHGGIYKQFELRRLPGQESLESLKSRSPTTLQKRQFKAIKLAY
ncbi:hypothetical protein SODALDRAFT_328467 [Sodiomyces alkalinus F11]|uniref:YDG domain-containing protein n=1 Tax=Sodiomyces alkalinus (strain CBS 110278 / VKM F-3762 / F11) TaxID=1314773 RepID=A0A3N2PNT1_SODAK|nr:hypothetical protein SODALDRAFT_328467 [Sodiomyces alkalinus F11]ROT36090.1 hypothetical protein SODALDRAFT_328467 [Sodiomyces alkalinus F11]